MSNRWLNIRFGVWHLIGEYGKLWVYLSRNEYHAGKPFSIEIYDLHLPWR